MSFIAFQYCLSLHYHSGTPSAPGLTVVAVNMHTLTFNITPPLVASQCVLNYIIIPTTSGQTEALENITITDLEPPITATRSGFDLCHNVYSFIAIALTLHHTGERSEMIRPEFATFLGKIIANNYCWCKFLAILAKDTFLGVELCLLFSKSTCTFFLKIIPQKNIFLPEPSRGAKQLIPADYVSFHTIIYYEINQQ